MIAHDGRLGQDIQGKEGKVRARHDLAPSRAR